MKYSLAYRMFNDMAEFAIAHGMTSYHSDLMHDAVQLQQIEDAEEPAEVMWIVKSDGCGTWMWNITKGGEVPSILLDCKGAKVILKYDGDGWTFEEQ